MSSSVFSMPDIALSVSSSLPTSRKRGLVLDLLRQDALQQAERLQRLAQIVAGGGEEARLAEIGLLGLPLGGLQRLRRAPALGDVVDRQQDLASPRRPVADLPGIEQQEPPAERSAARPRSRNPRLSGLGLHPVEEVAQPGISGVPTADRPERLRPTVSSGSSAKVR